MIRALILLVAAFAPVGLSAACLDGSNGRLPTEVTFQSGESVRVIELSSDRIRYLNVDSAGQPAGELTAHLGIFSLVFERQGMVNRFDWTTELPDLSELTPGASFHEEAMLSYKEKAASFITEAKVLRSETIEVDGCKFDVLRVDVSSWIDGKVYGRVEKWLHLPSLITLKAIVRQGDVTTENLAVKLE